MLILYMHPGCVFSAAVMKAADDLGLTLELRNINASEQFEKELLEKRGGDRHTPYLVDTKSGKELAESDEIVTYLNETYAHKEPTANP